MEEEEDTILLNSLGVTSVNPEDIERDILHKARTNAENSSHGGRGTSEVEDFTDSVGTQASSSSQVELLKKLRAIEVEIDAVASSVEQTKSGGKNDEIEPESHGGNKEDDEGFDKAMPNGSTLQHALAADRLKSLKKTRAELRNELSNICEDGKAVGVEEKLLNYLVREESKSKRKLKEVQSPNKESKKKKKVVSYQEDDEFDAVLNAASGGFVETERDELVRKGLFTPFHKLKGFERRIQQPGTSSLPEDRNDAADHASESVARAVRSLTDARQARPTSKLLEPKDLPRLDTPPHAFNRLNKSFKIPKSLDSDGEKSNDAKRKKRRPLPGERWRKRIAKEEFVAEEPDVQDDLITETQDAENGGGGETPSVTLEGGLKIPETIFVNLFDYQKVGVQWLWELHCQRAGGIIGDEMGLGKTIQVLAFLGSLHFSNMYKPSIIVCPVTLLRQWKREARKWYRSFHVEILHDSAVDVGRKQKQSESDESDYESEGSFESDQDKVPSSRSAKKWDALLNRVLRSESGLLITTYEQLRILGEKLLDVEWGYAVLDEGHRIRNPNAEVTIVCKQLQTVHRIIMTGAPIQNKLSELWSLFDFVFPGKLGVLPVFEAEFAVPIKVGGYANASLLQVSTAYRCAVVLRDLIMPYLLRRMKADVNAHLPKKTEHVLFCSLTPEQRSVYKAFLASSEVEQIFDGNRNSLYGIDVMRKICNHPDLLEREHSSHNPDYGNPERSGKMKVVAQVLNMWKEQGHRVLLFAQTQQMLDILENFLIANEYSYRRMDGLTAVKQRMALIDEFNNSNDVFIFILTTKVGGLGTNLTGANRVIIFDPDWNPSTDMQSAINHDAIMDAHDEEKMRLEEQASQVAQRAAEALRQSRMLRSRENIAVPTWTGKSGAAGAPSSIRRTFGSTVNSQLVRNSKSEDEAPKTGTNGFVAGAASGKALSSSELLAKIRGNQASAVGDGLEHQFSLASSSSNRAGSSVTRPSRASQNLSGVPPEVLIRNICTFIQNNGGSTSSATIVEHFRDRIPSKDLPLFKNLLKEIAILEKNRNSSVWVLKPEYQLSRS
ncbi:protein CHROMATIN REMODELING 8-like isoform X2 [Chenopodium quinoa]|uniref:protein CHROMATIN REMODELING 8-like isoform X2 n=1 Tax=Chenopodium quinoa TaxID=63459 RepID=UPI000B78A401|nr:protein CHROMATIN REMODELING 8-like isoform X2 [Chenopodium quinoa]